MQTTQEAVCVPVESVKPGDRVHIKCVRSTGVVASVEPCKYNPNRLTIRFQNSRYIFGTEVTLTVDKNSTVQVVKNH